MNTNTQEQGAILELAELVARLAEESLEAGTQGHSHSYALDIAENLVRAYLGERERAVKDFLERYDELSTALSVELD